MYTRIDGTEASLEEIRAALREAPLTALREMLPDGKILEACRFCGHQYRERLYGPEVTVFHFLLQAVQRDESFAGTWQEMWTPLAAEYPELASHGFDSGALAHARARLPREVLEFLAEDACGDAASPPATWRGFRLRALDGTMVSMPREDELVRHFGLHRTKHGEVRYPLARFVSLLNLGPCTIIDWRFAPHGKAETVLARPLIENLGPGELVLLDRGLTGSPTMARILARGAEFLGRKNARLRTDKVKMVDRLGRDDFIIELSVSKPARKEDPSLPETVRVRLFKARWKSPSGERLVEWFVTSLADRRRFKKHALAKLYHERWQLETSYEEFKVMFHSDVLRSKTVENVYKEFTAHVLAYQLTRKLMAAAAAKHGKRPARLSFLNAARWVMNYSHRMAAAPMWKLRAMYEALLDSIASSEITVRPGRLEPRAVARERKHYPRLRTPRAEWREKRLSGVT